MKFNSTRNYRAYLLILLLFIVAVVCYALSIFSKEDVAILARLFLVLMGTLFLGISLRELWRLLPREITIKNGKLIIQHVFGTKEYTTNDIVEVVLFIERLFRKATIFITLTTGKKPFIGSIIVENRKEYEQLKDITNAISKKNNRLIFHTSEKYAMPIEIKNGKTYTVNRKHEEEFSTSEEETKEYGKVEDEYGFLFGKS